MLCVTLCVQRAVRLLLFAFRLHGSLGWGWAGEAEGQTFPQLHSAAPPARCGSYSHRGAVFGLCDVSWVRVVDKNAVGSIATDAAGLRTRRVGTASSLCVDGCSAISVRIALRLF